MQSTNAANNHNSDKYFLLAFGLINLIGFTLLLCAFGLLVGLTISQWQFPIAFVLALIVNYYAAGFFRGEKVKSFIKSSAAILALVIGSILFAGYFYDVSFDGQWYHEQTVYELGKGYNPVYQELPVPPNEQQIAEKPGAPAINLKYLNINSFSKGTELTAAAIYRVSDRIETGKAVNIILLIASFFLCLALLYKVDKVSILAKWLLAIILAFNPIVVNELLSFCVDGLAGSLLLCLLVTFCLLLQSHNRYNLFLLAILIIITVNVKITSLVFAGMFCVGFLVVLLLFKNTVPLKKVIVTGIIATVTGILFCGFNPYVTNAIRKQNVFYGLSETRDELARIQAPIMANRNRVESLFISLAAHEDHDEMKINSLSQMLKVPFTFNKSDIVAGTFSEIWFSGFGPFFSGALCVAIIIFIIGLARFRKTIAFKLAGVASLIILLTVLIVPDCWWARFVPQLWLLPAIILVMADFISFRGKKIMKFILYLSLMLNVAWSLLIIVFTFVNSNRIDYQLQQVKALNQPVYLRYDNFRNFNTNLVRFNEAGIPVSQKDIGGHNVYEISYSTTKIETLKPLPQVPKPLTYKISEWILSKKGGDITY